MSDHGTDAMAGTAQNRKKIGEVVLALRVVGGEIVEIVEEMRAVEDVDAGVYLADLHLIIGRVLRFDDARDRSIGVAHDAAVHRGIVEHHRQQRERVLRARVLVEQTAQRLGTRQRNIAGEDQHVPRSIDERRRLQHRVTGALLLFLHRVARAVADCFLHRLALMADDHDRRPIRYRTGEIEDVVDDRAAGRGVKNLDRRGLHARALTGGEDDDVEVVVQLVHASVRRILSSVRP